MVLRGGRGSAAVPDVEIRTETETRPEPEIDNPAEIQLSMSAIAICVEGLGTTGPHIPETASEYVTADKPEITAAFPVSQEIVVESNPNLTLNPNPPPHNTTSHTDFSCIFSGGHENPLNHQALRPWLNAPTLGAGA